MSDFARPRTIRAHRGFDKARIIRDAVMEAHARGTKIDKIAVTPETMDDMRSAWLEMAPEHALFPCDVDGVPYVTMDMNQDFAFLREWTPWEKKQLLKDGNVDRYREGAMHVSQVKP